MLTLQKWCFNSWLLHVQHFSNASLFSASGARCMVTHLSVIVCLFLDHYTTGTPTLTNLIITRSCVFLVDFFYRFI